LPEPPLFPYTTLFRSAGAVACRTETKGRHWPKRSESRPTHIPSSVPAVLASTSNGEGLRETLQICEISIKPEAAKPTAATVSGRSEEHTSELQSRENL